MKKRVSREKRLPAFRLDLAAFEALIGKLIPEFGEDPKVRVHIELKNTQYDFSSVDEIRACSDLPSEVVDFRLTVGDSSYTKDCTVRSGGIFSSAPKVMAESDSEAWCAGVVEIVVTFISSNRRWYSGITGWPIYIIAVFSPVIFSVLSSTKFAPLNSHPYWWLPLTLIWLVCSVIYFAPSRTLPNAVLQVRPIESILRKFMPELTLLTAAIAVIVSIIGLFVK
ncbi:MAG: hypothetical protein Q7T58_02645 [Methylotenera sp.]|nr:hypothetical protein [Methylotenera sp.]